MILYYLPIAQNTVTVSDYFSEVYMLVYVCAHILTFFSIYWSGTRLVSYPAGTHCSLNIDSTLIQHHDVESTLNQCRVNNVCLLGTVYNGFISPVTFATQTVFLKSDQAKVKL